MGVRIRGIRACLWRRWLVAVFSLAASIAIGVGLPAAGSSVGQGASFAPFLDIVPSENGSDLFISVGNIGQVGGTVFANIGIGPGHKKGSWTMTYSDTADLYIATAAGFTPTIGSSGAINITTTTGLDSGAVEFTRAYVPGSSAVPVSVGALDGGLELLIPAQTFVADTYVAVVPSYALPGPPPAGYQPVGSSYSVRASGAVVEVSKQMNLRLFYSPTSLGGADPGTLAIFGWDAARKQWDRLGGTLFPAQGYLSVATKRFTTYLLMRPAAQSFPVYLPVVRRE